MRLLVHLRSRQGLAGAMDALSLDRRWPRFQGRSAAPDRGQGARTAGRSIDRPTVFVRRTGGRRTADRSVDRRADGRPMGGRPAARTGGRSIDRSIDGRCLRDGRADAGPTLGVGELPAAWGACAGAPAPAGARACGALFTASAQRRLQNHVNSCSFLQCPPVPSQCPDSARCEFTQCPDPGYTKLQPLFGYLMGGPGTA